jgi:hypothetical protein
VRSVFGRGTVSGCGSAWRRTHGALTSRYGKFWVGVFD